VVWRYPECKSVSSHFDLSTKCGNGIQCGIKKIEKKHQEHRLLGLSVEDVVLTVRDSIKCTFQMCHFST
jgi:hypothetical protein